jgi:hypothetical protein
MRGYMGVQNNPRLTRGAPPPMIWRFTRFFTDQDLYVKLNHFRGGGFDRGRAILGLATARLGLVLRLAPLPAGKFTVSQGAQ